MAAKKKTAAKKAAKKKVPKKKTANSRTPAKKSAREKNEQEVVPDPEDKRSGPQPPFVEVTRDIKVKLNDREKSKVARKLGELYREKEKLDADAKASAKHFKDRKGGVEAQISELSEVAASGSRVETVECRWEFNKPKKGKKSLVRKDTDQVVETLDMSADEKSRK